MGDILARSPGLSYQDLPDREINPVADSQRDNTKPYLGSKNLYGARVKMNCNG